MARKDKNFAIQLRKEGKTYREIREQLGPISKATLSLWFEGLNVDQINLASARQKARWMADQKRRQKRRDITSEIIQ